MFKRIFGSNSDAETVAPTDDKKPPQSEQVEPAITAAAETPLRLGEQAAPELPQPPPANEPLAFAMQAVAESDNPQTRAALYQAFLRGHFWMPIAAPPENPEGQDVQVQVPGLQDQEGNKLLAVFTDAEALATIATGMVATMSAGTCAAPDKSAAEPMALAIVETATCVSKPC